MASRDWRLCHTYCVPCFNCCFCMLIVLRVFSIFAAGKGQDAASQWSLEVRSFFVSPFLSGWSTLFLSFSQ